MHDGAIARDELRAGEHGVGREPRVGEEAPVLIGRTGRRLRHESVGYADREDALTFTGGQHRLDRCGVMRLAGVHRFSCRLLGVSGRMAAARGQRQHTDEGHSRHAHVSPYVDVLRGEGHARIR